MWGEGTWGGAKSSMSILSIYYTYLGLIISGGSGYRGSILTDTVEMFVPSTGQHCTLPDLQTRYSHTMEEMVVCGGEAKYKETSIECLTLTRTGWRPKAKRLLERR